MAAEIDHQKEFEAHAGTYEFFKKLMGRSTLIALVATAVVVWLIVS